MGYYEQLMRNFLLLITFFKYVQEKYGNGKFARKRIGKKNQESCVINPSHPNPGRREKIKLNVYFHTSLLRLKKFYEGLKGLHKTF